VAIVVREGVRTEDQRQPRPGRPARTERRDRLPAPWRHAAGEHTERSLILDLALALAEDRRRDIVRETRDGLAAARARATKVSVGTVHKVLADHRDSSD